MNRCLPVLLPVRKPVKCRHAALHLAVAQKSECDETSHHQRPARQLIDVHSDQSRMVYRSMSPLALSGPLLVCGTTHSMLANGGAPEGV